ncbi:MAG: hypothetical protein IPM84_07670 [Anaerolineae bacterium]|nr:hypothetical protein [Anaerolineae bacterium]
MIKKTGQWISNLLNILRELTPDKRIHCTDCVAAEYKPAASHLYSVLGRNENDYRNLAADVRSCLNQSQIDSRDLSFLRELPTAPRKLIGPGGVSDPDLSLVALGLHLADQGESVYILSNDKDLVDFSTWACKCAKAELRQRWANPSLLQGLQSLAYLEWVHQSCSIATDDMWQLLKYYMREHVAREDLGKLKGEAIFQSLMDITTSLVESAQIKAQARITNV